VVKTPELDGIARDYAAPGNIAHDSFARNYFAFFKRIDIKEQVEAT